jgi:hypothetical protein
LNQGPHPPFDPNAAVVRFAAVLKEYGLSSVEGDRYAGETFRAAFQKEGVSYRVSRWASASESYEAIEPLLNAHRIVLLDAPTLESQFLGLVWRGGKITRRSGRCLRVEKLRPRSTRTSPGFPLSAMKRIRDSEPV